MFRSKREVLATIKKRTMVKDGANYTIYDAFLGRDPVSGKKRRVAKSDLDELKKYITDFYKQLEVIAKPLFARPTRQAA